MADLPLEFTHSFFQQLLPRARYCLQSTKDAKSRHSADLKELTPSGGMDSNLGPVTSGTLRQAEAHLAQPPADRAPSNRKAWEISGLERSEPL